MKRVIVNYSKLTNEILTLLVEKFPDGYSYKDIVSFQNAKGEYIKAVEVRTEDTTYLVKISSQLETSMEEFEEDDDIEDEPLLDEDSFSDDFNDE